ncbi:MAG TPA: SPOR domain-containing protein [Geobacteraceae bacterium]
MVLDYHERRPVNKNRPKKRGNGLIVIVAVTALTVTFALGFGVGLTVGKASRKSVPPAKPVAGDEAGKGGAPAAAPPPAATGNAGGVEPPLTFYNTLAKGNKAVIGTGLNPQRPQEKPSESKPVPPAASPQPAAEPKPAPAPPPPKPPEAATGVQKGNAAATPADKKPAAAKGKFVVQVASYREKGEAAAIRDRLVAKGVSAYILESHVQDKGVWYRVRIGKSLSQQEAKDIATKVGKEALVIPE